MDHDATLELEYASAGRAGAVERSLRPEVGDIDGDRTRVTLELEDRTLTVDVEATDPVALRAGLNTWLTLAGVAERCCVREPFDC